MMLQTPLIISGVFIGVNINMSKWHSFYLKIKDPSWPMAKSPRDLTDDILLEIMKEHMDWVFEEDPPEGELVILDSDRLESRRSYGEQDNVDQFRKENFLDANEIFSIVDIAVYFDPRFDGGGQGAGQDVVPVINELYPDRVFRNGFEWCSGVGFMGFSLLAHNVCENLYLGDIYEPALRQADKTIDNLPEKYSQRTVRTMHMKGMSDLDESLKFDLIVSNPPHHDWTVPVFYGDYVCDEEILRMSIDPKWKVHSEFFRTVKKNLAEDGVILLMENSQASSPDTFRSMIEDAGLRINRCVHRTSDKFVYWMEITHK